MSRPLILVLAAAVLALPFVVWAQQSKEPKVIEPEPREEPTAPEAEPGVEEGFSLLEEGSKLILRGLLDEIEPTLKDLNEDFGAAIADMEPALRELSRLIGDIRNYHPPEVLPNGDIILRRKTPLPPGNEAGEDGGPIDL